MPEFLLVCEGHEGSLDNRVIDLVLAQKLGVGVKLKPSHGERGLGAVRKFLEESEPDAVVFMIEDRNYRPASPWRVDARSLAWPRHEIENYLLEPAIVYAAIRRLAETSRGPQVVGVPRSVDEVSALMQECARPLLEAHAAHVLLEEILRDFRHHTAPMPGSPRAFAAALKRVRTRDETLGLLSDEIGRVASDGMKVGELAREWLGSCVSAGESGSEASPAIKLEHQLDERRKAILSPEFLSTGQYVVDMDGHALVSALVNALHGLGLRGLKISTLEHELVRALDSVYSERETYSSDDFSRLRDHLIAAGAKTRTG